MSSKIWSLISNDQCMLKDMGSEMPILKEISLSCLSWCIDLNQQKIIIFWSQSVAVKAGCRRVLIYNNYHSQL